MSSESESTYENLVKLPLRNEDGLYRSRRVVVGYFSRSGGNRESLDLWSTTARGRVGL